MPRVRRDWIRIIFVTLLAGVGLTVVGTGALFFSFYKDPHWTDRLLIRIKAHEVEDGLTADQYCERGERILLEERSAAKMLRAQAYYYRALSLDPKRVEAYVGIALAEMAQHPGAQPGKFAKEWLDQAKAINPEDAALLRARAEIDVRGGSREAAIELLERAVTNDPSRIVYRRLLADSYSAVYRHTDARAQYEEALRLVREKKSSRPRVTDDASRADAEGSILSLYGQEVAGWNEPGSVREASALLKTATEIRPTLQGAWLALARIELEQKHCREAEKLAAKLKGTELESSTGDLIVEAQLCLGTYDDEADPKASKNLSTEMRLKVGAWYMKQGKLDRASKVYSQFSSWSNRKSDVLAARAELAFRRGNLESAINVVADQLDEAKNPTNVSLLAEGAKLYWASGNRARALALARRALEVDYCSCVTDPLSEVFGKDPSFAALRAEVLPRIHGLFDYFEREHHRQGLRRDHRTAKWAIWWIGRTPGDRAAVPLLKRYLAESSFADLRVQAADALWLLADRSAVPVLLSALEDPDEEVRGFAASALGDLGDKRVVEPLINCFNKTEDDEPRARVADALGKLGDVRALPYLRDSLGRNRKPAFVKWAEPAVKKLEAIQSGVHMPAPDVTEDEDFDGPGHSTAYEQDDESGDD